MFVSDKYTEDICAINDPLGQIPNPASSYHYSHSKFVLFCDIFEKWRWMDVQKPRAKIVITTGCGHGSASWINRKDEYVIKYFE